MKEYKVEYLKTFGVRGKKTGDKLVEVLSSNENSGWELCSHTVSIQGTFMKREWHMLIFSKGSK